MKLKFVDDAVIENIRQGRTKYSMFTETIEELYKHPNQWVEFHSKVASATAVVAIRKRYKDIETRVSGGNNLAANHPDKKLWTVYLRYVPSEVVEEETF